MNIYPARWTVYIRAVSRLVDPIKQMAVNGPVLVAPSLYDQLVGAVPAKVW